MTERTLPFSLATGEVLEARPRLVLEDGAVFARAGLDEREEDHPPLLTVAWLAEPPGATLAEVVDEELVRALDGEESTLIDREDVTLSGVPAVRTLAVHCAPHGLPTASEQWRLLAAGRRWTLSAMTTLADQPVFGPPLARVAATFRVLSGAVP